MLPSAQRKMQRIRLQVGALIAGACACTANADHPSSIGPSTDPGSGRGAGGGTGAPVADGGDHREADSMRVDAALTDVRGSMDGGIFVIRNEAAPTQTECAGDLAALGTNRLLAGGATPARFAEAYNGELMALSSPGPFLLALTGVNETTPSGWIAVLGALGRAAGGAVTFGGTRAAIPFSMSAERAIRIDPSGAQFVLSFAPSTAAIPAVSVALSGMLANACSSLSQAKLRLLLPASAGVVSFHGSTVGELMGPPTESWGGNAAAAWPLELSGTAQEVYAVGIVDAGAEP